MINNALRVLVLNGSVYGFDQVAKMPGVNIKVPYAELNFDINGAMVNKDLHDIVIDKYDAEKHDRLNKIHLVVNPGDPVGPVVVVKMVNKYLVLMGHSLIKNGYSKEHREVPVRLVTTVSLKKIRIDAEPAPVAPPPTPSLAPYQAEFKNHPRFNEERRPAHNTSLLRKTTR